MKRIAGLIARYWANLWRPSAASNSRALRERGESVDALVAREATPDDIPALADLHVETWNATYAPFGMKGPPVSLRAAQWREAFAKQPRDWFCIVLQRADGMLVGFAKGIYAGGGGGELNKLYLRSGYQRLGLGRRLFCEVARRLHAQGAVRMSAYTDARNPSGWFFEKQGGHHRREPDGRLNTEWYHWDDLAETVQACGHPRSDSSVRASRT